MSKKKTSNDLEVKPLPTDKSDVPQSPYMKSGIIAKFPSMCLNIGRSGSGKTTVINYMMTQPNYMKGFFDSVYLFSPTAELDDLAKHLKLKKENLITDPTPEKLMEILDEQESLIKKHGIKKVAQKRKVMIIFDDIVSNIKFLKSPAVLRLCTMGRHYLISSIFNTQAYKKIPRSCRLQANSVIFFPASNDETLCIAEDHTPPSCSRKDFYKMVEYATKNRHEFMYINMHEPPEKRYRKGFKEYLVPKNLSKDKK